VRSVAYSPDGRYIISGSYDGTIQIWDAVTGAPVGTPLKHVGDVCSVAYSPDGQYIISGSSDKTIQIWNAETGAAMCKPLEGHTDCVSSVTYSPNGQHIVSGSDDSTIRIWDAKTGTAVGKPLKGHSGTVRSVAYSPDGQRIVSGSTDATIHVWDSYPRPSIPLSSSFNPVHDDFVAQPDADGWVRDSMDGLLYWVPPDCRVGLYSPALLTIPPTSHTRSVSLDLEDFAFGTAWTQIFNSAQA
jgi:WD40 repeat protein